MTPKELAELLHGNIHNMATTNDKNTPTNIEITSIVSGRTFEPLVNIKWGNYQERVNYAKRTRKISPACGKK